MTKCVDFHTRLKISIIGGHLVVSYEESWNRPQVVKSQGKQTHNRKVVGENLDNRYLYILEDFGQWNPLH